MLMDTVILFVLFFVFMGMGIPVGLAMAASAFAVVVFLMHVAPVQIVISLMSGVDVAMWAAIPLFLLLGSLMNQTGVTRILLDCAQSLIGHVSGGLSHVSVLANIMMAGISGSINADAAALGAALIPSMKKQGYPGAYAAAIIGAGATIGPTIPPSLGFIMIGIVGDISILRLYLGGIISGLLIGASLLVTGYFRCRGKGYATVRPATWVQRGKTTVLALPALFIPVGILGGMRAGLFTATEGAVVGICYILIIGFAFYGFRNLRGLKGTFASTGKTSSAILMIAAGASPFSWVISTLGIGPMISGFLTSISTSPLIFLLLVIIVFLILGGPIESVPLTLIFVPLLMPTVHAYRIDPVQFGVLFNYLMLIGQLSPPEGTTMFIVARLAECSVEEYTKEAWPFLVALTVVAVLMALVPQIVTFLPDLVMGKALS